MIDIQNASSFDEVRAILQGRDSVLDLDGIIGTDETESPDLVFGPVLGHYREAVAFRPGETSAIDTTEALDNLRVGGIAGYEYSDAVAAYVSAHQGTALVQLLSGDTALEQNLRKLLAGRVDLVPEERSVLAYNLAQMDIATDVEIVLHEDIEELFIAFSPNLETSEIYARQLRQGVQDMHASGRIAEIMRKYGVTE